jgi:rSAM/selenodomain-associated transferase 1
MAKVPGVSVVKSRLHPALGVETATRLYECFLRDRLDALSTVEGIDRVIAFTPGEARHVMAELAPFGFTLLPQRGADLGARLDNLLTELLGAGHPGAVAMDSDSPTLPLSYVAEAAVVLAAGEADAVVGPCDDGGYYLIGLRASHPELFEAMPWSTERVLPLTLERAQRSGLRTHVLPTWFDVDTEADLLRLQREIAHQRTGPPRTVALIHELFAAGVLADS